MVKINRFNQLVNEKMLGISTNTSYSKAELVEKLEKLNTEYEEKCKKLEEAEKEIKGLKDKVSNLAETLKLRMSRR